MPTPGLESRTNSMSMQNPMRNDALRNPNAIAFEPNASRIALALVLVAFAIRFIGLGRESLWYDEGYTIAFASQNSWGQIIAGAARLELNTPLHYLLLSAWMRCAGQTEFAARALSAAFGVLTAAYAHRIAGRGLAGALAVLFVGTSAVALNLSQEVRMYALTMLLCTASTYHCLRVRARPTNAAWASWAGLAIAAFLSHVLAAFVIGAQMLALLPGLASAYRRDRRNLFGAGVLAATGLAILALAAALFSQRQTYGTTFADRLSLPWALYQSAAALVLPRLLPERLVPAAAVAAALMLTCSLFPGRRPRALVFITALAAAGIAAFCALTGKFAGRYVAIVAPLLWCAVSAAIASVKIGRAAQFGAAAALASLSAAGAYLLRTDPVYRNDDFRSAAAYLRAHLGPDESVFLIAGHFAPVFDYYGADLNAHPLPPDPVLDIRNSLDYAAVSAAFNQHLAGGTGAWLLLWQDGIVDPTGVATALLQRQAHELRADFTGRDFAGLTLMHFSFDSPFQPSPAGYPAFTGRVEPAGQARGLSGVGCYQLRQPRAGSALMEVMCVWQVKPFVEFLYDTKVSLRLSDAGGRERAHQDQLLAQPKGMPFIPFEKPITSFYFIEIPTDLQNGEYTLTSVPYDAAGEIAPRIVTPITITP